MKQPVIGLMDFGIRESHLNSLEIVADLLEYAQHADRLGFARLWLPEHHTPVRKQPWTDPTTLLGLLAASTESLRVGVAGILLAVHQPYHVATSYKMLANLFPDRIDLGLANGRLSDELVTLINGPDSPPLGECFARNLRELLRLYASEEQILEMGTVLPPYKGQVPDIWSLSTNMGNSLRQALEGKTNLARSIFHKGADRGYYKAAITEFRHEFVARHQMAPQIVLVLSGTVHDSTAQARRAAGTAAEVETCNLVGTAAEFEDTILRYQEDYGIDEFIINHVARSSIDRLRGLELWSELFTLDACSNS